MLVTPENYEDFLPARKAECPTCGTGLTVYPYNFNKSLAKALVRFAEFGGTGNVRDAGLTNNQYCTIWRLQHWGLFAAIRDEDGERRQGLWYLTDEGWDFYHGYSAIKSRAFVFRSHTLKFGGDTVYLDDVLDDEEIGGRDFMAAPIPLADFLT
jgi:hypothetical protein